MWSRLYVFLALGFVAWGSAAQDCDISVQGVVIDEGTSKPLSFVNVVIQELSKGGTTDDDGFFQLEGLCSGHYHLIVSHIGCDPLQLHLDLERDTIVEIQLLHTSIALDHVVITGDQSSRQRQPSTRVSRQQIEDQSHKSIAGLLENEPGVYILKNGNGIGKPVVHGMYGNRLTILNNGVPQAGQQWGNDHAPEIDPLTADNVTVVKGAAAVAYAGGSMGSILMVEPKPIGTEPHLHGHATYSYETNGRGHNVNGRIQQYTRTVAWRLQGSLKRYGDRHTPRYFLNNTGVQEVNASLQLEKSWSDKLFVDVYTSTFNTELGVLRGSHIGSTDDLEVALQREQPFFTEPDFSYDIEAPKQDVSHHLVKLSSTYYVAEDQKVDWVVAGQYNSRKEFDIRRSGRTDIPALSLSQYTISSDIGYSHKTHRGYSWKVGSQTLFTDNTNDPETGILPLIPDYLSWMTGAYGTVAKQLGTTTIDAGLRYDYTYQNAVTITRGAIKEIVRYTNNFHNTSAVLAVAQQLSEKQSLSLQSGYAVRSPAINELYSNGLHQGVSGIEEGDVNLQAETGVKTTLQYKWQPSTGMSLSALTYYQYVQDYIFLQPEEELRPTIRGAFPVFSYDQTDAGIFGLDISSEFTIANRLQFMVNYSYIKGDDRRNDIPLVFMPPTHLSSSMSYRIDKPIPLNKGVKLDATEMGITLRAVQSQSNLLAEQDFAPAPPAYTLLGLTASTNVVMPRYKIRIFVAAENILNTTYRDYLNRLRYFADEQGRSVTAGVTVKF